MTLDLSDRHNMFYWQTNRNISAKNLKEIFLDRAKTFDTQSVIPAIEYGMQLTGKSKKDAQVNAIGNLITDGLVNNVVKAQLADNTEVIFRMHPPQVKNGYFWVERVASQEAKSHGVPSYSTYIIVDDQKKFPFDFMILEALPGQTMRNFTHSGEIGYRWEEQLIRETGKYVGLIHTIKPKGFGFFKNDIAKNENRLEGQYHSFDQHIYAALDMDLTSLSLQKQITPDQIHTILGIFKENHQLMNCDTPVLIHNDIADWNQLSDGNHVTGIVDWDECISGDPVMEFSAYSLFFGEPRMTWFKEGYSEVNTLPDNFEKKFQLFKLRYLISKLSLRIKMASVHDSDGLQRNIKRGFQAMNEVFQYFGV